MLRAVLSAFLTATLLPAVELPAAPAVPAPAEACHQLRGSASWVRPACVSIKSGSGSSCGTVIASDGLILTAAHAIALHKVSQPVQVTFENGTQTQAQLLGANFHTDYALLQIVPHKAPWPYAKLAESSPDPGTLCFVLGHPGGRKFGRPAQLRLGRVTSLMRREGTPWLMTADCDIQPGDSGAGLFSLDGRLIGLASSAGNFPGYNRFPGIENLLRDRARLLRGERWGTIANGPSGEYGTVQTISRPQNEQLRTLFTTWTAEGHRPSLLLAKRHLNERGEVHVEEESLQELQPAITFALSRKEAFSLGLDDPALTQRLPARKVDAPLPLAVSMGNRRVAHGLPLGDRLLLTKDSELRQSTKPIVVQPGKGNPIPARIVARDTDYDLALLQTDEDLPGPFLTLPALKTSETKAGELLFALDATGQRVWGIASDEARPLDRAITAGPLQDARMVSKRPAPFPVAISHNLPLYAVDGITPIFNEQGQLAGIHAARLSRTLGVMIPADILASRLKSLRQQLPPQ